MSRTRLTPDETEALGVRCIYCTAKPGEWCNVITDYLTSRPAARLHGARWRLLLADREPRPDGPLDLPGGAR